MYGSRKFFSVNPDCKQVWFDIIVEKRPLCRRNSEVDILYHPVFIGHYFAFRVACILILLRIGEESIRNGTTGYWIVWQ